MADPFPHIITLGCRLNVYESEIIRAHTIAAGLNDIVIINSCAVTGMAERQTRQIIRKARREYPDALIVVTGCAAQIHPEKFASMSEVDTVIGNVDKLKAQTYTRLKKEKIHLTAFCDKMHTDTPLIQGFEGITRAFVQIQNGCNNHCTFCIIPKGRGPARSVEPEKIIEQIRHLAAQDYPEITLTGVDISSYNAQGLGLGGLVKKLLVEVPKLNRLRLSSLDPAAIEEDLWDVISYESRLMPSLHLSVQAGDDMILKRMKRRHSRQDIYDLVTRARKIRPDIVFGADVIAGFPTEDDAMFDNTRKMFEELDFTWMHVFPYSARVGTPAAKMPQVKDDSRKKRAAILRTLGEKAVLRHLKTLVGKRLELHVEGEFLGRAPTFAEVTLTTSQKVGRVIEANIIGVEGNRAVGQIE